jgi:hypothetical protein
MRQSSVFGACALAVVLATTTPTALGQNKASVKNSILLPAEQQWEYIVVSYGKTIFASPQKTLAYRTVGLQAGDEAINLEKSLDILGRFGWEVVSIVGSIGGDQQIVLKRKYNRNLVKGESSAILNGKDLYIKDLIDIMEREQRLREEEKASAEAERNLPRLIELEGAEALTKRIADDAALVSIYKNAFEESGIAKFSTINVNVSGEDVTVKITSDVTNQFLTNGNAYRRSDVMKFIDNQVSAYRTVANSLGHQKSVSIYVNAVIQFGGKSNGVYSTNTRYFTSLKEWY